MVVILVEGDCECNVVPIIVQREMVKEPVKCIDMRGKSNIIRSEKGFEGTIRRQYAQGYRRFIVLMDKDITYAPYKTIEEEERGMSERASVLSKELRVSIDICWAALETESWLIGGLATGATYCSLRNISRVPNNTEASPADPKNWLQSRIKNYDARTQRCLAENIDTDRAKARNTSLVLFLKALAK